MTDTDAARDHEAGSRAARMIEVLRLATALAEQMLASQIIGRAISAEQFTALVSAARLLQDNDVPWPPLVQEVVYELAARMDAARPEPDVVA